MYLFYNLCTILRVSKDYFFRNHEFMIYCLLQLCTNHAKHGLYFWFVYINGYDARYIQVKFNTKELFQQNM